MNSTEKVSPLSSSQFLEEMIQRKYNIVRPSESDYNRRMEQILSPLLNMNLAPEHYVMVFSGLSLRGWKNIYRHILVQWSQLLLTLQSEQNQTLNINYKWQTGWSDLALETNFQLVQSKIMSSLEHFLQDQNQSQNPQQISTGTFRILFLINTIHNYFIPL